MVDGKDEEGLVFSCLKGTGSQARLGSLLQQGGLRVFPLFTGVHPSVFSAGFGPSGKSSFPISGLQISETPLFDYPELNNRPVTFGVGVIFHFDPGRS